MISCEVVVDFRGTGGEVKCELCGSGRSVRLYKMAERHLFLNWECAAILLAEAERVLAGSAPEPEGERSLL